MTEPEKPRRRVSATTYALATALIALLSSGTSLLFTLNPGWRPDPRTTRSADVAVVAFETATRGEWVRRSIPKAEQERTLRAVFADEGVDLSDPASVKAARRRPGTLFFVQTKVEGFKRDNVTLAWSIYDARTRSRLKDDELSDQDASEVRADAPTDRSVARLWAPDPYDDEGPGPFFARFELRDENGVVLAIADSKPFRRAG